MNLSVGPYNRTQNVPNIQPVISDTRSVTTSRLVGRDLLLTTTAFIGTNACHKINSQDSATPFQTLAVTLLL